MELDDADAALDDDEPLSADQRTFAEIRGYRQALGYVLAMAKDPHFRLDASALNLVMIRFATATAVWHAHCRLWFRLRRRGDALESTRTDPYPWLPAALLGRATPLSGRHHEPQSRPE